MRCFRKGAHSFAAIFLLLTFILPLSAFGADLEFWDLRNKENVTKEVLSVTVDSIPLNVTRYQAHYYDKDEPNQLTFGIPEFPPAPQGLRDDLQINIYVPEGATNESAVIFSLQNGSWAANGFPTETVVNGGKYSTSFRGIKKIITTAERAPDFAAFIANALARDMVIVSYGARSRGSVNAVECASTDKGAVQLGKTGKFYKPGTDYVAHTPATIADTKAAIAYLKYNIKLGNVPADKNKIIVVGHSGGGALATIIGATGNSSDYKKYLVNAAPATNDVFGVLASAPITDLPMADFAYEFTYGDYREDAPYDVNGLFGAKDRNPKGYLTYNKPTDDLIKLSDTLAADYADYVFEMFGMTTDKFIEKMTDLLAASIQHEIGLDPSLQYDDTVLIRPETDNRGWYEVGKDGTVVEGSFDLETYLTWMMHNVNLGNTNYHGNEPKGVIAFMGEGIKGGYTRTENNLWGKVNQRYSIAYEYLWDRVIDKSQIHVEGYADWDAFWEVEGEYVGMQMKMTSPMPYLTSSGAMWYLNGLDKDGDKSDVSPNWFVRHGICDADTSVAIITALVIGIRERADGDLNCYFGWERDHNAGMHYGPEFYDWLDSLLD